MFSVTYTAGALPKGAKELSVSLPQQIIDLCTMYPACCMLCDKRRKLPAIAGALS